MIERALHVSPSLASTIGLEAALLYQLLSEWQQFTSDSNHEKWHEIQRERLEALLPFWNTEQLNSHLEQLQQLGMLHIGAGGLKGSVIRFSVSNAAPAAEKIKLPPTLQAPIPKKEARPSPTAMRHNLGQASKISSDWRPDKSTIEFLHRYHNIEPQFIDILLAEFIAYWQESGKTKTSWNSTFMQWAGKKSKTSAQERTEEASKIPLDASWQPNKDTREILERSGIHPQFISDSIPEFIIYWQERGTRNNTWNSQFVKHVRLQWAYFQNEVKNNAVPQPINKDWQPSEQAFDVLRMANISADFAIKLVPEFVLYWLGTKQLHRSWDSKFLQHAKFHWANNHKMNTSAKQQTMTEAEKLLDKLNDTSWADGLVS